MTSMAAAVFIIFVTLVPARHSEAVDPWYRIDESDAARYIGMSGGQPTPYPWGGRWLLPSLASLFGENSTVALQFLNYLFLLAALVAISYLTAKQTRSQLVAACAWIFTASGAAFLLLFQNPYLMDSAGLFVFAAIGLAYIRKKYALVALLIVTGVTIKEVAVGFVILLLLQKRWTEFAFAVGGSCALLMYGMERSEAGSAILPEIGIGVLVKFWFGLNAAWPVAIVGLLILITVPRFRTESSTLTFQFFATTLLITFAALPIATDTSRLLAFALPATVPLCAQGLSRCRSHSLALGTVLSIPAILTIIPTRISWPFKPDTLTQLESWYATNILEIGFATAMAIIGSIFATWRNIAYIYARIPRKAQSKMLGQQKKRTACRVPERDQSNSAAAISGRISDRVRTNHVVDRTIYRRTSREHHTYRPGHFD
ncbi:hypothetical protein [Rhodococcus pyridinivorans]